MLAAFDSACRVLLCLYVFQLSLFSAKLVFVSPGTYFFGVLMLDPLEKEW